MNKLILHAHGQRVHPMYVPLPGETQGTWGKSTDEERPEGHPTGIARRYRKEREEAYHVHALGWIKAVYADAIEYTSVTRELKGMAFFLGILYGVGLVSTGLFGGLTALLMLHYDSWVDLFFVLGGTAFLVLGIGSGSYLFARFMRFDLFRPTDLPIIFDRKHRKVYRILREEYPGFMGVFKRWPLMACEYDWDLVDAEHNTEVFTTGGTVSRNHFLMFIVRKSKDDPTIIDSFQIANASSLSEDLVSSMWEHIRRFMEENGPHLPTPDEPLASQEPPQGWWQSMGAVGPLGPKYLKHWRDSPGITLLMHLIFPMSIPMFLLWGTGNWLSYKTAIPVEWPDEVRAAVGPIRKSG